MHLTALVESPDHVCCRYRLAAFRPFLERTGHTLELVSLPRRWWDRIWLYRRLHGAAVVLQRKLLPPWELALLRRSARLLFFDLDDAVFHRDSYAARGLHHAGRMRRFAATVRACDAVIAGNDFLAAHAARWAGPARVHVVPTCVDPALYSDATAATRVQRAVQLVWVGSSSTLRGLEAVRPMLEELGRARAGRALKDHLRPLFAVRPAAGRWRVRGRRPARRRRSPAADVGISWVPDDDWSRGKCGLKVLQYMAAGLPVVANPVGVHAEMVRHGETGFLAETTEQWVDGRRPAGARPGAAAADGPRPGGACWRSEYTVARGAGRWLNLLDGLRSRRKAGGMIRTLHGERGAVALAAPGVRWRARRN